MPHENNMSSGAGIISDAKIGLLDDYSWKGTGDELGKEGEVTET